MSVIYYYQSNIKRLKQIKLPIYLYFILIIVDEADSTIQYHIQEILLLNFLSIYFRCRSVAHVNTLLLL